MNHTVGKMDLVINNADASAFVLLSLMKGIDKDANISVTAAVCGIKLLRYNKLCWKE